jgi:enterochelin esterase family protein
MISRFLLLLALVGSALVHAQDTSLHDWLIEGEGWKVASEGYAFTDALCCDKAGNLFFSDVKGGKGIYKIDVDTGKTSLVIDNLPGISGLQFGPDGRFYACHNKAQRVIAFQKDGSQIEELLAGIKCNDLVVTSNGNVYVTETPTQRIHLITAKKEHRVVDEGHVTKPNGISVSPDQRTLAVSDVGGKNVWAWHIEDDGSLTSAAPYMTMACPLSPDQSGGAKPGERPANLPVYLPSASGDGMTTEANGRWFVTTALGVQVFDQAGRLSGILDKPTPESKVVSVEFAGKDHDVLFIAASDKIYSRKLKVKGWFESK